MKKVLVVDDEPKLAAIARDYLVAAGFDVVLAEDGLQGLALARKERPDLIVLDLMLPGMDGLDVCREIRRESNVPIVMLTARIDETDKLIGLELGADDYLTKPFSPRELVARVRVILRRAAGGEPPELIRAGTLMLDRSRYQAALAGRTMDLTPTEFEILSTLAGQPGRIFSRDQLLSAAHGISFDGYERAIDWHIRNLRRKLEAEDEDEAHIITVHGVGYKYVV